MPDTTQSTTQQTLQNLTGAQTNAQPNTAAVNNGNPGTVYNIPPQADANGNWWNPPKPAMNTQVAGILGNIYGQYQGNPTTPTPVPIPPGGVVPPPIVPTPVTGTRPVREALDGGRCVAENMYVHQSKTAGEVEVGFETLCHTPEDKFHVASVTAVTEAVLQPCVELVTSSGARLICSITTPFTFVGASADLAEGQWAYAPDMVDQLVYVLRDNVVIAEPVMVVAFVGEKRVVPISFQGKSFPAGHSPDALIYSHNIYKFDEANVTGQVYGFGDTGMSGGLNLSGSMDQSHMGSGQGFYFSGGGIPLPESPTAAEGTPPNPTDPEAPYGRDSRGMALLPPLPRPDSTGVLSTITSWLSAEMGGLVPRDADGTVDWQGLMLESLIGPAGGLIDTTGK